MKTQQVTSLLLCVLLSSTVAHDYLRAKRYAPSNHHLSRSPSNHRELLPSQERSTKFSGEICEFTCNDSSITLKSGLEIIFNGTTELIGVVNVTAKVALIIDIEANLIGLFNGSDGAVIIFNLTSQTGLYIAGGQTDKGWISAKITFDAYFNSLTSLSFFYTLKVGVSFKNPPSTEISTIIGQLLVSLSASYSLQIQSDVKAALTILISIGSNIITLFRGQLKGLLKFAESGLLKIRGDIVWLVGVFKGLGSFFGKISGGLAWLIKKDVQFKLSLLLAAANGVELLINLLLAIIVKIDLSEILKNSLNNFNVFISLIIELGGNVTSGVTGVFKVVEGLIGVVNGSVQIDVFFGLLLEYTASRTSGSGSGEIDISIYLAGLLDVITVQNATYSDTTALAGFISIVTGLSNKTLKIGAVNISAVISSLTAVVKSGISFIISILVVIQSVIQLTSSIPKFILYIIQLLATASGSLLVSVSFGIKIQVSTSGALSTILNGVNLISAAQILTGNIAAFLKGLPIIGTIYTQISAALKADTNGSFDLDKTLSSSTSIVQAIYNLLITIIKGQTQGSNTASTVTENHWFTWHFP